jgi:hypothetical protein
MKPEIKSLMVGATCVSYLAVTGEMVRYRVVGYADFIIAGVQRSVPMLLAISREAMGWVHWCNFAQLTRERVLI